MIPKNDDLRSHWAKKSDLKKNDGYWRTLAVGSAKNSKILRRILIPIRSRFRGSTRRPSERIRFIRSTGILAVAAWSHSCSSAGFGFRTICEAFYFHRNHRMMLESIDWNPCSRDMIPLVQLWWFRFSNNLRSILFSSHSSYDARIYRLGYLQSRHDPTRAAVVVLIFE